MFKKFKKAFAGVLAGVLALSTLVGVQPQVANAEESADGYEVFIAFGGDKEAENDWGLAYTGTDSDDVKGTKATIKEGETVKVGLEFANPVVNAWYFAPAMVATGVTAAEFEVKCFIDGAEVAVDMSQGDNWWAEDTGDYKKTDVIRIAGGFNEWGAQYIAEPTNFKKLEYEITAKKISFDAAAALEESNDEYDIKVAFGGDKAEENDWGWNYDGSADVEGITATLGKIKAGETVKVGLEFADPVFNVWYTCPFIPADLGAADITVKTFIDGEEVAVDMSKGDMAWAEAVNGVTALRLAGGFNEWGAQYIAEPANFKKIEYEITCNKLYLPAVEEKPQSNAGPVDKKGKYNAYIGFQTPKFSFRNAFDEASYGRDDMQKKDDDGNIANPGRFGMVTGWGKDDDGNDVMLDIPGTFTDAVIEGNGTYEVKVTGLEFPEGEFADQDHMNLIFLSTDIPNTDEVTIKDIVLKVDGTKVDINPIVSPDSVNYLNMAIQNTWNDEIKSIGYYPTPMKEMVISFTVEGFDYDKDGAEDPAPTEEPKGDATTTPEATTTEAPKEDAKDDSKDGLSTGAIVGIVAAAVVAVGGCTTGVVLAKKKKAK